MKFASAALALAAVAATFSAQAQVRNEKNVSLALATEIAQGAVAECAAKGYAVTATVVDRFGGVRVVLRGDNNGPHSLDSARRKAWTAASFKSPTSAIQKSVLENPQAQQVASIAEVLALAGGLPIKAGNEVIGGVGVGGAPGGQLDEQCAAVALDKVKDKLI